MKKLFALLAMFLAITANLVASPAGDDVDPSTLKGRDLYDYQMSHLNLLRLKNKRSATSYLTTNTPGEAIGARKASSGYSQIWIAEKAGNGYTLRSANTGQYLQGDFAQPAAGKTTLYFQFSPNNTGQQSYVNLSSAADFSGQTCLNLNGDGKSIYKWSYAGDAGSDWAIELADDVTEEEIRAHFSEITGYASEVGEGKYYRIISTLYGLALTEGGELSSRTIDPDNFSQYWQLQKVGTGFAIQSVVTQKFIQRQTSTSTPYRMGNTRTAFKISPVDDKWESKWTIAYGSDAAGLHTAATQSYNVVLWSTNADASVWAFEEVELTDEQIEAARGTQLAYDELVRNKTAIQGHLDALFADKACTTLKEEIQALTDEQLAANEDYQALNATMQAMVLKVKNDTWQQFTDTSTGYSAGLEKFFRVADYQIYSNYQTMANASNFTMSNSFGKLSGPTGIVAKQGDIIYVYVSANPKSGSTLQLEAVNAALTSDNNRTGETTALRAGLNVFMFSEDKMLYIFHELNSPTGLLANFPDVTVHIEGGELNGYWDATRGMTNADWKLMQQTMLKAPMLNLKTKHLVFQMNAALVKSCEPNEIEGLMRVWDRVPENEERYMGVEDFEGRYRNIWNCFSIQNNYMYATTYGTYYNETTLPTIMNYSNMTRVAGNLWGPSHEMGHNHQASINVIGTTESSNNMFSNINIFEQGIAASRRHYPADNFTQLAAQTPWLQRDIWLTTSMFFQLYLYFHAQHHDDNFLPNLFRALRQNPINKGSYNSSKGGNVAYGRNDYLHLAKKICDVAEADLSEFFEAYGMFIPVSDCHVSDYTEYYVTTSQSDINAAKAYMQKYERKLGNIMFIDDRVIKKQANPDNIFEGVPARDGYRVPINDENPYPTTRNYVSGDYESYTDGDATVADDYYTLSSNGKTITFYGTNYAGHKFYDAEGNLVWATVSKSIRIPDSVLELGMENLTIVTAQYDMKDRPCLDKETAVRDLQQNGRRHEAIYYDLSGRRVSQPTQGLYIQNGKKVVR